MSGEMALWAVRQAIDDPIAKLVLVALCENCNEVGDCYPNHETLVEFVRRSKPYIRNKIRWLEQDGWITRKNRYENDGHGRQTSCLYILHEDRGETRKDYHARKKREAAERAEKRAKKHTKTTSGVIAGNHTKSGVIAGNHPPLIAGNHPYAVIAGNHPRKSTKEKEGAHAPISNSPVKKAEPAAQPEQRRKIGPLMQNLAASLKMQNAGKDRR